MVRSMTGFGRGEASGESIAVTVEVRSVNHRHLDVALRLPRSLAALELDVRRLVQSRLERGRIDIAVQLTPLAGAATQRVQVDAALAREYVARARALDELVARRTAEGDRLAEALRTLHGELTTNVELVSVRAPATTARREDRLRDRLRALLAETAIDQSRIVTEAAVWADKSDVTEELARLRAHLAEFTLMLGKDGPVGRPLDFLIQELNREINTVASKADDLEMSQAALTAKGVLEKIREQVQNLE